MKICFNCGEKIKRGESCMVKPLTLHFPNCPKDTSKLDESVNRLVSSIKKDIASKKEN